MAVATGKLTGIYFRLVKKTGLAFRSLANRLQTRDLSTPLKTSEFCKCRSNIIGADGDGRCACFSWSSVERPRFQTL